MNSPNATDFDFPAFPAPAKVSTAIAQMNPLNLRECGLVAKRVENGFLTPDEERQLAEVYAELDKQEANERRELHPNRKHSPHE